MCEREREGGGLRGLQLGSIEGFSPPSAVSLKLKSAKNLDPAGA